MWSFWNSLFPNEDEGVDSYNTGDASNYYTNDGSGYGSNEGYNQYGDLPDLNKVGYNHGGNNFDLNIAYNDGQFAGDGYNYYGNYPDLNASHKESQFPGCSYNQESSIPEVNEYVNNDDPDVDNEEDANTGANEDVKPDDKLFETNKVFSSAEEMTKWAQNKGVENGIVIITGRSRTSKLTKKVTSICLTCDRGGSYHGAPIERKSGSKKIKCPFELEGKYKITKGGWVLKVKNHEHNHEPSQFLEGHPFAMRLNEEEFQMVDEMTRQGVKPDIIMSALKEKFPENKSSKRTLYNARAKIKRSGQTGDSKMQVFFNALRKNKYDFRSHVDEENVVDAVFFIHPKSHKFWRAFPHVLMIDSTYKTNKYRMPFVQMVGVTSTLKSFCVAHAFMNSERREVYKWVLDQLDNTLETCYKPRVIVTDRELALMNACKDVFPLARRLVCRWHIFENIIKHCKPSFRDDKQWRAFEKAWTVLIKSPDEATYESNRDLLYRLLVENHGRNVLIPISYSKTRIVRQAIPLDDIDMFWRKLDFRPALYVNEEKINLHKEFTILAKELEDQPEHVKRGYLARMKNVISSAKSDVNEPNVVINTRGRPSKGKKPQNPVDPPRHSSYEVPYSPVDPPRHSSYEVPYNPVDPPRHSSYEVPYSQGRYSTSFVSSQESKLERSKSVSAKSKSKKGVQRPAYVKGDEEKISRLRYLHQIPNLWHGHIIRFNDVLGDGNCGFRSLAVGLGRHQNEWPFIRQELANELFQNSAIYMTMWHDIHKIQQRLHWNELSFAPTQYWADFPTDGVLAANRFNVIVLFLSNNNSFTCFPNWKGPEDVEEHKIITIAHVNNNHFINLELDEDAPLSRPTGYWRLFHSEKAQRWEELYKIQIQKYLQNIPLTEDPEIVDLS